MSDYKGAVLIFEAMPPLRCCWRIVAMTPTGFARRGPHAAPLPAFRHAKAARCRPPMMPPSTGVATGSRTCLG